MTRRRVSAASQKPRRIYRRVRLPLVKLSKVVIVKRKATTETAADTQAASTAQATSAQAITQQDSSDTRPIASTSTSSSIDSQQRLTDNQHTINATQAEPSTSSLRSETTNVEVHQASPACSHSSVTTPYQQPTLTEIASFNPDCNPYMNFISGMPQILAALPNEAFQAPKPEKTEKTEKSEKAKKISDTTAKGTHVENTGVNTEAVDSRIVDNKDIENTEKGYSSADTSALNNNRDNNTAASSTNTHRSTSINNPFQMLAQQNAERLRKSSSIRFESPSQQSSNASQVADNSPSTDPENKARNQATSTANIEPRSEALAKTHTKTMQQETSQEIEQPKVTERKKVIKVDNKKQSSFQQSAHSTKHPFSYLQLPKASIRSCPDSVLRDFNHKTSSISPDASIATATSPSQHTLKATLAAEQSTDKNSLSADETVNQNTEKFNQIMASLSAAVMVHKSNNQAFNNMMQQRVDTLFQHHERWGSFPWENVPNKLTRKEHFTANPITSSFIQSNQTINATAHPQFNQHNGEHYSANDHAALNTSTQLPQGEAQALKKKLTSAPTALASQFSQCFTLPNSEQSQPLQFLNALEKRLKQFPVTELTTRVKTPIPPSKHGHAHTIFGDEYLPKHTTWVCHTHNSVSVFEFFEHYVLIHQANQSYCLPKDIWRNLWQQAMQKDPAVGSPREHIQACRFLLFGRCFSLQTPKAIVRMANQSPLFQRS